MVLEGGISRAVTISGLHCSDGERPAGDLIPWTVSNAFQNYDFPQFSGARILRIASHPSLQGRGYGSRAVDLLKEYYATNAHLADCKKMADRSLELEESMKVRQPLSYTIHMQGNQSPFNSLDHKCFISFLLFVR